MEAQVTGPVRRPENHLQESVLSVSHTWHGNRSEVHRLGSRRLYAMSHLNSPELLEFKIPQRKKCVCACGGVSWKGYLRE